LSIDGEPYRYAHLWTDLAQVVVRFWDSQRLARYEQSQSYFIDDPRPEHPDGPLTRLEDSPLEQIE